MVKLDTNDATIVSDSNVSVFEYTINFLVNVRPLYKKQTNEHEKNFRSKVAQ